MIYLGIILALIIIAVFFAPINVVINSNIKGNNVYYVDKTSSKNNVNIVVKILGCIPIYKYNNKKKLKKQNTRSLKINEILEVLKESVKKEEFKLNDLTKKIFKWGRKVKFKKFILIGGFNTEDYMKNAYINASINSIICMFINANQENFNLDKLYYQVSISDYKYYLTLDIILSFPLINNIDVFKTIITIVHKLKVKRSNSGNNMENNYQSNYFKSLKQYDIT